MAFESAHWLHWMPHPESRDGDEPYAYRWLAPFAVSLGVFLVALDITIVGVVGPALSDGLGATASQIQWAFDAFTVVMAGFVVLCGGLAERYGRKGLTQLGMLVFALGSAISAFAPTPTILIVGRIVAGLGAAGVFPALFVDHHRHVSARTTARCHWYLCFNFSNRPDRRSDRWRRIDPLVLVGSGLSHHRARLLVRDCLRCSAIAQIAERLSRSRPLLCASTPW